ncbi:hypothetical protein NEUTE1DRAFT_110022 [Neurospora tetrasperma FGSC 2508]|uniref:Uncharacterized protein n=1 Tax=Neurospora tetrasperma (strain FGSC 2508 / ATCC MYA-4615 / P0657) TaxID=510951 RepID=F8MMG8_NEUT8|nr:uncharacterized protein NEUTE1DRAFT_110022 [Neurospora tetrasperma FGSC 2508]EGO57842.1 hypothetical protein NEUTE1DRAFT_110022 [Neurospora tetrasperma FGSC 2508]EGZ71877.1 hypothetical protein NEUTE2DRAFT_65210 [Neurospora tetrasperma FGSC 2509]
MSALLRRTGLSIVHSTSQKFPNSPTWALGGDLHPIVLASHFAGTKRPASIHSAGHRSSRSAPGYHPPALRLSNQTAIRPYSLLFHFTNKHIPYNDQSDSDCVAVMEVTAGSKATEIMKSSANRDLLGRTGLVHKTVEAPLRGLLNSGPGHGMSRAAASSSLCVEVSSQLHPRSYLPLLAHKKSPHIFQYFWHGNNTRPGAHSSSLPTYRFHFTSAFIGMASPLDRKYHVRLCFNPCPASAFRAMPVKACHLKACLTCLSTLRYQDRGLNPKG